jgi:Ca2+-binding RTX toxin-like protein
VIDSGAGSDTIYGKGGDDLLCGNFGGDAVYGGPGNDRLTGGRDSFDLVEGGPGNDYMVDGGSCCWELAGGDTVSFRTATGPVTVDLPADKATGQGTDTVVGFGQIDGSDFGDTLIAQFSDQGTPIRGFGGNDLIIGYDGPTYMAEIFMGGMGNDTIRGRDGAEYIVGGQGDDTLVGGPNSSWDPCCPEGDQANYGATYLSTNAWFWEGSRGAVTVDLAAGIATGEQGRDTLRGFEIVWGSTDDDTLLGDEGDNKLYGEDGTDTIDGRGGTDSCGGEILSNCE